VSKLNSFGHFFDPYSTIENWAIFGLQPLTKMVAFPQMMVLLKFG
jgi:hypothetical protein